MPKTSRAGWTIFGILVAVGMFLHAYRVSYPAAPVFDEAHDATYAADYVKGKVFFDIHPPLGKLIYAAALKIFHPEPLGDTDFIEFIKSPAGDSYISKATNIPFRSYPYVPLRLVGGMFGVALAAVFYFFLRSVGVGETGALLGVFFVTFENALLLDTRLILMNGMYLALGFAALAAWFAPQPLPAKRPWFKPVAAGILFGLSLGVKLTGVVFLGPILIDHFFFQNRKEVRAKLFQFAAATFVVFALVVGLNLVFFSPERTVAFLHSLGAMPIPRNRLGTYIIAAVGNTILPWSAYVVEIQGMGLVQGPMSSQWYLWPLMRRPVAYYFAPSGSGNLLLTGNFLVWYAVAAAISAGIVAFLLFLRRSRGSVASIEIQKNLPRTALLLLGGYITALGIFPLLVWKEATFLYHYFPAFLFGIGFLAWASSRALKLENVDSLSRRQVFWLAVIVMVTVMGFLAVAPKTYGF